MALLVIALVAYLLVQSVLNSWERVKLYEAYQEREQAWIEERAAWAAERGRLVSAVKSPTFLPVKHETVQRESREPEQLHRVGTINLDSPARNGGADE